jgi:hypothetical protein
MINVAYFEEAGLLPEPAKVFRLERTRIDTEFNTMVVYVRADSADHAVAFVTADEDNEIEWDFRKSYGGEAGDWSEDDIEISETAEPLFTADAVGWKPDSGVSK